MGKKGKFILIFGLIFVLFISGIIVFKNREDRINQANKEIEQLVEMKEYDKLRTLFMDYEKMNKNFGLTEVEFLGSNWEKKLLYNGEDENLKKEFIIGIYTGKLYEESNHGGYDNIKTDVELIEEYIDEYDVYEYSDADEFYYDHKDDFEGYEDAEGYYEDAWSLIDENTEYLIR